jgi:hypothetical protein
MVGILRRISASKSLCRANCSEKEVAAAVKRVTVSHTRMNVLFEMFLCSTRIHPLTTGVFSLDMPC